MSRVRPDFLIVGTPRSGTTLVQRLACELPGVRIPPETHFFRLFAEGLLHRRRFPLEGDALRHELDAFGGLETAQGLQLDTDAITRALGGSCQTVVELFGAIVCHLAGDGDVIGEKTPSHLRWWRPLTDRLPGLRIVGVVRDPRAVVASYFEAWGKRPHAVIAERWSLDQRDLAAARAALGGRCLLLRYEDVVRDPGAAKGALAGFLGVRGRSDAPRSAPPPLRLRWEIWKDRVEGPITADRIGWSRRLGPSVAADVAAIAGREMELFGYAGDARRPTARAPLADRAVLSSHYRAERRRARLEIERLARLPEFA